MVRPTREQCRAARGLLNWSQARLGAKANVSEGTVRDFENGKRVPATDKLLAMQAALEMGGVAFLSHGQTAQGGGPGVRLRKPTAPRTRVRDGEAGIIENSEM
ncbi:MULTISPECIES: helix-turn-helix transcriptional regulator [Mesorhizobium]|uniref:helix-turn-helix domain-containing protein n=1 Tax=Mesorhizobium TaxID=68287 RepID=UPI000D6D4B54|nr:MULTISPECIES: helix-turn-helix transcriptional regulator [Mesorhizobium]AZO46052.1 XRE family transcriptional regulator [Mesorhizobium sp. M7D.F.Ca.US.005.01.1.1]RUX91323.1 XRE family transcriptional regulator [Mesorhizobium sp. M7D.F.Ca.US.004.01.2.1]RVA32322.1 XRE family transcriptional regulator [Mesorhizobium sp. M7D.F.Ca.US.004.03.1.1]